MTGERAPSPASTGGAGVSFEGRVGAVALSRLLRGDLVAGLGASPTRVGLQRRVAGAVLDDIVFHANDPRGGTRTVEYQVKRIVSLTAGDPDFRDIVGRCLAELEREAGPILEGRRSFGIASRPGSTLNQMDRVVRAARAHSTAAEFFQVLRSSAAREVRDRLKALRDAVEAALPRGATDAVLDDATWHVASALYVWPIDAEPDTEDVRATLDRLADLMPAGKAAGPVFSELVTAALEWAAEAGVLDVPKLRSRLEEKGFALDETPVRRIAFRRLQEASQRLLDPAAATLGRRLHLPRMALRRAVRTSIEEHGVLALVGRAGVGKSIMARLVARDLVEDGAAVIVISLTGRNGPIPLLEQELGASLKEALAGAPIGGLRVLVVDGAEQALTDGGQLLGAVLNTVPVDPGCAPPWRVLLTSRDEAVPTLKRLVEDQTSKAPSVLAIGELDDNEVAEIVKEFPGLAAVERSARSRALLLRRPYIVELLVRAVDAGGIVREIVGEEDVFAIVRDRLIGLDRGGLPGRGAPFARGDLFLRLGQAVIDNAIPVRLDDLDSEAREGLLSDDIITEVRSGWRFAHDILADYAAAIRLLEPDGGDLLAMSANPRRLLRGARLCLQRVFADALALGRFAVAWHDAQGRAERLAGRDGPRWRDTAWEALLNLGNARSALDELRVEFLANDGVALLRLIDVTERRARRPIPEPARMVSALDVTLSAPVVDFLIAHAAEVPDCATGAAARLVYEHLAAAVKSASTAASVELRHAIGIPDAVVRWAADDEWGRRLGHAIGALALSGAKLCDRHDEFLLAHARTRPDSVAEAVEGPWAARRLAVKNANLLLRLSGLYYLGRGITLSGEDEALGRQPRQQRYSAIEDSEDGVRDHSLEHRSHVAAWPLGNNLSNPEFGPFAALLDCSPAHGLRLVGAVVDAATRARTRLEDGFRGQGTGGGVSLSLELSSPDWPDPRKFAGPDTVWLWHRRTSVGPGPALSALMALRQWAVAQIRGGEKPRIVRDQLLSIGPSLAFVSVALSALVDRIDDINDELDPFLSHPMVWRLENVRVTHERGASASDVPEANRLSWTLSSVAMLLVLRADDQRRERLRGIGKELVSNHAELEDTDSELLVRRWAAELNIDNFVAKRQGEGVAISISYPASVFDELRERGTAAEQALRLTGIMTRAVRIRDGQGDLADAVEIWRGAVTACAEAKVPDGEPDIFGPRDTLGAAAAALVLAAAAGREVADAELRRAAILLVEEAADFERFAPPVAPEDVAEKYDRRSMIANMTWHMGVDRSIATAVPCLLLDGALRQRSGVSFDAVVSALVSVATTPFDEVRQRLVDRLRQVWSRPCGSGGELHQAALHVARRMIVTEGLASRASWYGFLPIMLPEPIEETIRGLSGMSLDVAGASFGVLLADAARCNCHHGLAARRLVDSVIDYDRRVWPAEYAREHYSRTEKWRAAIDAAVADRAMAGDDAALDAHLSAFAHVGEELRGLLEGLVARAVDSASAARLHEVWPRILDRFLPGARDFSARDDDRGGEPYAPEVERLDRALILIPPEASHWPVKDTFSLGLRWLAAYRGTPHVVDRAIFFVARMLGVKDQRAIQMVLAVLGGDIDDVLRSPSYPYVVSWLQVVLSDAPNGETGSRLRRLLDLLAASGDQIALDAQRKLEL